MPVLLNLSNTHLFWQGREPEPIEQHHRPFFLAFPRDPNESIAHAHTRLATLAKGAVGGDPEQDALAKIFEVREPLRYKSFWNPGTARDVIPVVAKRSYWVPDISDRLFFDHGFYTCEHDIPYTMRAGADLVAEKDWWILDTKGHPAKLSVLTYDIETTQYGKGTKEVPIDVIGFADFEVEYESQKDLDTEQFDFRFHHIPNDWAEREVRQLVSRTPDEEIDHLEEFTQHVLRYDMVAGHNILGFDNKQIHERIIEILQRDGKKQSLSPRTREHFKRFTEVHSRPDRSFHFGTSQDICLWYPGSLDTFHAARKFYFFHDDFTLKGLAPWLGVHVPDRVYLEPHEMDLGPRTLTYNKQDVQEQMGITQQLIAQALPLAFTTNQALDDLLTAGNTKMWDHMAFLRCRRERKFLPATCRAQSIARSVQRALPRKKFPTREEVSDAVLKLPLEERAAAGNKEFIRVAKQGPEMPFWCEHPSVIVKRTSVERDESVAGLHDVEERNRQASTAVTRTQMRRAQDDLERINRDLKDDPYGYAIPGGMTLKPDSELKSHFVPWYHVVAADVGAMYPTILKARNLTADTVVPCRIGETPDDWVWLFELDSDFAESGKYVVRKAEKSDNLTKGKGWLIGVKQSKDPGMVNLAMTGILSTIQKVKTARAEAKRKDKPKDEIRILDMTYASLKAARNAGTHGILVAVNVSCRQFNVWGGANITTIGQRILSESLEDFEAQGIRVVYGDSVDGARSVVVRDPTQRIRVMPLSALWDAVATTTVERDGKETKDGAGWAALAMAGSGNTGWHPLTRIIRHAVETPLWRIGQRDGETVCTEDHSLMVDSPNGPRRARPREAIDQAMVRVKVPTEPVGGMLDLLEWIEPLGRRLSDDHRPDNRYGHGRVIERFHHDDEWIWYGTTAEPEAHPRFRRRVAVGSAECSALMRLLGAYVAEGSVHWSDKNHGASIAESDPDWLAALEADYRLLFEGGSTSIIPSTRKLRTIATQSGFVTYQDSTHKLQMYNMSSALLFWALGGKNSRGKHVWDMVFNLPRAHQEEFLAKAVEGDGSREWGPRYRPDHQRHFRYETASERLASGLSVLLGQLGVDHGIHYRPDKRTHRLSTRDRPKPALRTTIRLEAATGPVYDLEVEGAHTFVDAMGCILLHNTDGIYLGCSKSAGNIPHFAAALDADVEPEADKWITMPDKALAAVATANRKWRDQLQYEGFELEAETHDAMVFVVHKNYLVFDAKNDKLVMETKGNNFKGSDKAPLALRLLRDIMAKALRDVASWSEENAAREAMKAAIKKATKEVMASAQVSETDWNDLILKQSVSPIRSYEANPDGTLRSQAVRAAALEQVIGESITATRKFKFVVCKDPLPLYKDPKAQEEAKTRLARAGYNLVVKEPKNRGLKPIEYMWPLEKVNPSMVDWAWYRSMVEDYVKGAFGFDSLELATQRDLSSWF